MTQARTGDAADTRTGRLPGIEGVWVLICGDLIIFTLLFGSFMQARSKATTEFELGRSMLTPGWAGVNTLVLITSSWMVVRGLHAVRAGQSQTARRWVGGAAGLGAVFAASKVAEYTSEVGKGFTPASDTFAMYYYMLTGIHLLHVIVGTIGLCIFVGMWRGGQRPMRVTGFESMAVFWHMVDLLWIVLFPMLCLMK